MIKAAVQFTITQDEMESIDHEIEDISKECYNKKPSSTFLNMSLMKLLIKLSRAYVRQNDTECLMGLRPEVQRALESIEQTLLQSNEFTVHSLATTCALSPGHFSTIFKTAVGLTPMEYYQRRRVQYACRHLMEPDKQVTDIAHDLGYTDSAHFCHFFRRYQKMSPSQYRSTLLNKKNA